MWNIFVIGGALAIIITVAVFAITSRRTFAAMDAARESHSGFDKARIAKKRDKKQAKGRRAQEREESAMPKSAPAATAEGERPTTEPPEQV